MGIIIVLGIQLAILGLVFFAPVIASILIRMDYVFLLLIVWGFVFGASGHNPYGLLADHDIHIVFVILTYLAVGAAWAGLLRIKIFKVYVFRIVACAISAYLVVTFVMLGGFFGQTIAEGMDIVWQWTVGIVCFAVALYVRSIGCGLIERE